MILIKICDAIIKAVDFKVVLMFLLGVFFSNEDL